ncbi:leucine-rich repeat transmembrane protein kinase protein [Artemisia annua]|uniref:Leucine-rich repeat transmembrane protein kinase protein n=1 Tax=Artemisia annua TaxID=35608 RepID=A0A2U1PPI2_ARTAN|nr:leucine-rich repeat transmembrane protein kinase protein [Artemisia annua]
MTMLKSFCFLLIIHVALPLFMGYAQDDQSGFISIDCGIPKGSKYTDTKTGINYVSDDGFVEGGISQEISSKYVAEVNDLHLKTLRSFPTNIRNCYTLQPKQGKNNRYLIRVWIMYGNYDSKGNTPQFDLYLGADLWNTVNIAEPSDQYYYEIIHLTSSNYIHICLVNTGHGDPFISAIELRLLDITMYLPQFLSLDVVERAVFTTDAIRYQDDKYDRIWYPQSFSTGLKRVQTTNTISSGPLQVPLKVMRTALTNVDSRDGGITHTWDATIASNYIAYIHFAEVEILKENEKREFNVYLNDNYWDGPISPSNIITTLKTASPLTGFSNYTIRMTRTSSSTLPPTMNAIEVYMPKDFKQQQTDDQDAAAIWSTKSSYGMKRNWQGDPCSPKQYVWNGLKCSYKDITTPRIISLDLSYNNLTGNVPKFLASLNFLAVLNLTGNKFTRPLPEELLAKSKNGLLLLRFTLKVYSKKN